MKKTILIFGTIILILIIVFIYSIAQANNYTSGKIVIEPILQVSPDTYLFNDTYVNETTLAYFTFANNGDEPLVISDISFTNPVFSIDYTSFTIQPGESGELPVHFTPTASGFYEGTMQVWSNDLANNPNDVQLSGNGIVELNMGWEYIDTGIYGMFKDIEFPEGQNQIGFVVGQDAQYNGNGFAYKTTDSGYTWELITPVGIPGLEAMSFVDLQTGYVAGWDGFVLKTTDGGATWDTLTVAEGLFEIVDIEFRDANHGIISDLGKIYITDDGGLTWSFATEMEIPGFEIFYTNDTTVFTVGYKNTIYKSTDGGYNWTVKNTSGVNGHILIGVDFLNENYGVAVGDYGYVFTTTDAGETWNETQPVGDQLLRSAKIWDTDTSWICGTPEMVFKSINGGTDWELAYNGDWQKALYRIRLTDNYTGFMCLGNCVILRKEGLADAPELSVTPNPFLYEDTYTGETTSEFFTFSNTGTDPLVISDITFTNPAFSIEYTSFTIQPGESGDLPVNFTPTAAGLYEGTMQIWSDDPNNNPYEVELSGNGIIELIDGWEWIETGYDFILMDIEFPEGQNQIGYSVGESLTWNGDGIVIKTTDGGTTWTQMTPDGIPGLTGMSFIDMNTGYAVGFDDYLIKTSDGGLSWDTINFATGTWGFYYDVEFYDVNNGVVIAGDQVYVTSDGAASWTSGSPLSQSVNMIEYVEENTLVTVGNENTIFKSIDGGLNWVVVNPEVGYAGPVLLGVHFMDNLYGMAVGDYGFVFTTEDGGDTWVESQPFGDALLHAPYIWDEDTTWVAGTPEFVYKTTDGGGSWNSAYAGNYQKAFYRITFTDNYTGFICGGSGGIVLRKEGLADAPELSVTPNPFDFGDAYIGETSSEFFTFSNTGTVPLVISDITFTNPAFSIEYTSFTIQPGESGDLPVHFTPTATDLYEGTMQIWSDDPINNPYNVELSGNGIVELIDGWEWIETGYNFILMDIEFPEGQNQIGYSVGESYTYNGDGIVIKTTDGGTTWTQMTPDGIPGLTGMSFIDMNTGYAVGWDDYLIKTTDGGLTWDIINFATGTWSFNYDVEFYDANNGVVLAGLQVYVTSDGGASWTLGSELIQTCNMIEYVDENTLVTVGNENAILKSTDGGLNWVVVNPAVGLAGPVLLGVHFMDNLNGMAAGDYGFIFTTEDGGDTWIESQPVGDVLFHTPYMWDKDTAWVVGTPEFVFKTTDGGNSWSSAYTGNYQKAFYRITFTDNYTGFICGGSGGIVLRKEGLPEVPEINITPEEIEFDDTYVGENTTEILTISNTGFADLEVTDITSTENVFSVNMTSFTIAPGEEQEITVTFTPDAEETYEGLLEITNNDPYNNPLQIQITGDGILTAPLISVEPNEIEFENIYVGGSSTEIVTISNNGNELLSVTDITSTNEAFTVDMTSFTVDPGNNQEISITFTPDEEGLFEGILQIENNDPSNSTLEVPISGTGLIVDPSITADPVEISFDTTFVDETSTEILTIGNDGIATLLVTDILSSNSAFTVNLSSFELEPNETQEIEVSFAPTEQMMYEETLQIESNDPEGVFEIDLYGYGDIDTYIEDLNNISAIKIYPNPAKDNLYIENIKDKEIHIYDLLGNLKITLYGNSNTEMINISGYPHGIYLVKIIGTNSIVTRKMEVAR